MTAWRKATPADAILVSSDRPCLPRTAPFRDAVKDRPTLALLKRVVLVLWSAELWLRRALSRGWRRRFWDLRGECRACGCCCVEPSIHVDPVTWHLPLVRWLLCRWQYQVNGLEYQRQEGRTHDLIFRCSHYDPVSKHCDSYASRPSMCRDYPRVLLGQAWPELFETCGYRVLARKPEVLRAGIEATSLSPEAKAELRRKLRLDS